MKEVDLESWNRKEAFRFFKDFDDPFFNLTAPVDITLLAAFCREQGLSISLATLYCALLAANGVREFRIRLIDGNLFEFDLIHGTQTILLEDETFAFCYFEMKPDIYSFVENGRAAVERYRQLRSFDVESERLDLIYFSVIPWVAFTSFKNAQRLDESRTVPRIVFGKMYRDGDRTMIPVSVEVHHAIVDGLHVGRFFGLLQERFDNPLPKR